MSVLIQRPFTSFNSSNVSFVDRANSSNVLSVVSFCFFKDFKSFEISCKRAALVLLSGDEVVLGDEKVLIVEGTTVLNRGRTREIIVDDKSCEMENKNDGPRLFFVVGGGRGG